MEILFSSPNFRKTSRHAVLKRLLLPIFLPSGRGSLRELRYVPRHRG